MNWKRMKYIFGLILFVCVILICPLLIDWLVFGNTLESNLNNEQWASFLGSYSGGVATLVGVIITLYYTDRYNRQIDTKRDNETREEKRLSVMPYLECYQDVASLSDLEEMKKQDRIFEVSDETVNKMKYKPSSIDRKVVQITNSRTYYLKLVLDNVGAGNAIDMDVTLNNYCTPYTIRKDETATYFMFFSLSDKKDKVIQISFKYWDIMHLGKYEQNIQIVIEYSSRDDDWILRTGNMGRPKQIN